MTQTVTKNEDVLRLREQYLTDRRLKTLYSEIASIYNCAIPKALVDFGNNTWSIVYDEKVEYEVQRIKDIINEIVKQDYSKLFNQPT